MAQGIPDDGEIITLEISEKTAQVSHLALPYMITLTLIGLRYA